MPRKKLIYTHLYPYHVYARSNNREWFYLPIEIVWQIFIKNLNKITNKYSVMIHSFVLLNNHYHMILTTDEFHDLGVVMCDFQKSISREINKLSGRTNHVFGGPYKASLIQNEEYYYIVYKYVYRNPIKAGLTDCISKYKYSSFNSNLIACSSPANGIASMITDTHDKQWINNRFANFNTESIKRGLKKTIFKPVYR